MMRRNVALKVLPEEMAGRADLRARILAEARAASALNHPSITTIHEVGEAGEQLFIVMELLTGKTLRTVISEGPTAPRALIQLGAQVAEGLAAAHAQGVVHGDIKPENFVLEPDGRVKLLDFGIARQMAAEAVTMTRTEGSIPDSRIAGTVAYMAPEQFRGEPGDARADLYSLGVVLYQLAAGHRPFPGPGATALMARSSTTNRRRSLRPACLRRWPASSTSFLKNARARATNRRRQNALSPCCRSSC